MNDAYGFGEIRYTLDGSDPTEQSALYTAPFGLPASTEVRARLFNGRAKSRNIYIKTLIMNCSRLICILLMMAAVLTATPAVSHINVRDGLSSRQVYEVEEDPDGFIWIFTNSGLTALTVIR